MTNKEGLTLPDFLTCSKNKDENSCYRDISRKCYWNNRSNKCSINYATIYWDIKYNRFKMNNNKK